VAAGRQLLCDAVGCRKRSQLEQTHDRDNSSAREEIEGEWLLAW
jgi:hypothetical protein